jgi:hypothetical protein
MTSYFVFALDKPPRDSINTFDLQNTLICSHTGESRDDALVLQPTPVWWGKAD